MGSAKKIGCCQVWFLSQLFAEHTSIWFNAFLVHIQFTFMHFAYVAKKAVVHFFKLQNLLKGKY